MYSFLSYFVLLQATVLCEFENDFYFSVTSHMHKEACKNNTGRDTGSENICCGDSCDYEADCGSRGTCCLPRRECIVPRFLSSYEETEYPLTSFIETVWMETRCDEETVTFPPFEGIKDLCENQSHYDFLESQLPVTYISNDSEIIYFRNVFCAYCWNISPINVTFWHFEVHCNNYKQIPTMDENILGRIRQEKCNMFYRPQRYDSTNNCAFPSYTVSHCNQTKLWNSHNETIEWGCNKFLDPFNSTYKNYFCYICNVDNFTAQESWYCPAKQPSTNSRNEAGSILKFNIQTWRKMLYEDLSCSPRSFLDNKAGKCRKVNCHKGRVRHAAGCLLQTKPAENQCLSFFVRITVVQGKILVYNWTHFQDDLIRIFYLFIPNEAIASFEIFARANLLYNKFSEKYLIVKIMIEFDSYIDSLLYSIYKNFHRHSFRLFEHDAKHFLEISTFSEIIDDTGEQVIEVRTPIQNSSDTFRRFTELKTMLYLNKCQNNNVIQLHKTHFCPFLTFNKSEISVSKQNNFLKIKGHFLTMYLSNFDFHWGDRFIRICQEDYSLLLSLAGSSEPSLAGSPEPSLAISSESSQVVSSEPRLAAPTKPSTGLSKAGSKKGSAIKIQNLSIYVASFVIFVQFLCQNW